MAENGCTRYFDLATPRPDPGPCPASACCWPHRQSPPSATACAGSRSPAGSPTVHGSGDGFARHRSPAGPLPRLRPPRSGGPSSVWSRRARRLLLDDMLARCGGRLRVRAGVQVDVVPGKPAHARVSAMGPGGRGELLFPLHLATVARLRRHDPSRRCSSRWPAGSTIGTTRPPSRSRHPRRSLSRWPSTRPCGRCFSTRSFGCCCSNGGRNASGPGSPRSTGGWPMRCFASTS